MGDDGGTAWAPSRPPPAGLLREPRQAVAALRLVVLAGLASLGLDTHPREPLLFWALTVVYGVTTLGALASANRDLRRPRVKAALLAVDVGLVGALVVLRGGIEPGFVGAYLVLVLVTSLLEGIGRPLGNALVVAFVHAGLLAWAGGLQAALALGPAAQVASFLVVAVLLARTAAAARAGAEGRAVAEQALERSASELEAAREALRANERLATLGLLSGGLAREIQNPLACLASGFDATRRILDEVGPADGRPPSLPVEELGEIVRDGEVATRHLVRVAEDLEAMSRGGPVAPAPLSPADAVASTVRLLGRRVRPSVRLVREVRTRRAMLADAGRVSQVLLHLATNALEAMDGPDGGTLTLRAEDAGAFHVALVVEDTGPGIPPAVRDRVFHPFFSTKGPGRGTGLGLHLVAELVAAMRGRVAFESRVGEGTRFTVELPVYIRRSPYAPRTAAGAPSTARVEPASVSAHG